MESTIEKMENEAIRSSIWNRLKGLFKKHEKEPKDMAMFHCLDCGNDFEAERYIMDLTLDDYGPTMTAINTIYCPSKCPKCGNWATTQKTIQTYRVPCAEKISSDSKLEY